MNGKHIRIRRDICQKTTSQAGPDPYGMETLDGIQHHEHRKETLRQLAYEPQDIGFHLYQHSGKAVSWNVGPHGYQKGKKEIHQIFEQGPPIISLQDVRIPKRRENAVKRELQRVFPHYWIYITTAQSSRKDCRDRPYVYSVLTALHSAFFPKVTQMRCHHSRQMDPTK